MRPIFLAKWAVAALTAIAVFAIGRDCLIAAQTSPLAWIFAIGAAFILFLLAVNRDDSGIPQSQLQSRLAESLNAQEQLALERERLGFALAATKTGVWEWHFRSSSVLLSSECREILGAAAASTETLSSITRFLHPDDSLKIMTAIQAALETEGAFQTECRIQQASGAVRWVLNRGEMQYRDGRTWRLRGTIQDITERKRAERLFAVSEKRHRTIIDAQPECVKTISADGKLLTMNPAGLAMLEARSLEEVQQRPLLEFLCPQYREAFLELHRQVMGGGSGMLRFEVIGLQGAKRWLETRAVPLRNEAGDVVELLGITRDITEQQLAKAELHASEERLQAIVRALPDLILRVSSSGHVLDHHIPRPDEIFRDDRDLRGQHLRDILPQEFAQVFEERLNTALLTGQVQILEFDFPTAAKGNQSLEVRMVAGHPGEAILILRNVTEMRQMETRLRQKQKLDAIAQLASGVAHDFNNLLTVINGNNHLLGASLEQHDARKAMTGAIEIAGAQAAKLTRQLLSFSREMRLEPETLNVNEVIEQSGVLWRSINGQSIEIVLDLEPRLWSVVVDRSQLEQVLLNLVINARDAMPDGGRLTVQTRNRKTGGGPPDNLTGDSDGNSSEGRFIQLAIVDTGSGMSAEVLSRIFEPFFTTKDVGQGSGLGLPMCHGIVKQSGGWIDVSSEVGRGSAFRIMLPGQPRSPGDALVPLAELEPAASPPP